MDNNIVYNIDPFVNYIRNDEKRQTRLPCLLDISGAVLEGRDMGEFPLLG